MPVFGEKVEEDLLTRMSQSSFFVKLYTESWSLRKGEAAIDDFRIAGSNGLDPGIGEVVEMLLNFKVGRRGSEV